MSFFLKKRFLIPFSFLVVIGVLLYYASDIVKGYINKNSKELTGIRLVLDGLSFNYVDISVKASGLTVFEADDTTLLGGMKELFVDFEPWKLLSGEYAFSQVTLDSAWVNIVKHNDRFNFQSLFPADSISGPDTLATESNLKFLIDNIKLINGNVRFYDADVDNRIVLDNLTLSLPRIAWNNKESNAGVEFMLGESGMVRIGAQAYMAQDRYSVDVLTKDVEIGFVKNYLSPYLDINKIAGLLNLNLKIDGSMKKYDNIIITGNARLCNFMMSDKSDFEFIKIENSALNIDTINLSNNNFSFDTLLIQRPFIHAELLKGSSNFEKILRPILSLDESSADSATTDDGKPLHYNIDRIIVDNGEVSFADLTLNRPFTYALKSIALAVDGFADDAARVNASYSVDLNEHGGLKGATTFSITDPFLLNHKAKISRLQLQSFSPYSEYYLARGITGGHFSYDFSIDMSHKHLLNQNSVVIQNLDFGHKTGDTTATRLPVRLALYLLKDKDGRIAFDLPVTGNPSDPQFKLGRIIWKTVANFLVKTAASPFNALGSLVGDSPDKLKIIEFQYLQDSLAKEQTDIIDRIAAIHQKKPEMMFVFQQFTNPAAEKNFIAIDEVKKMMAATLDSAQVRVPIDNDKLLNWLSARQYDVSQSLEAVCRRVVGEPVIDGIFAETVKRRNQALKSYFEAVGFDEKSFRIENADFGNITEEMKKPHYKVNVELP